MADFFKDMEQKLSKKTRTESDLIGSREVPEERYPFPETGQ